MDYRISTMDFKTNHMKKPLLNLGFLAVNLVAVQAQDMSGTWEGIITQEKGGILGEYIFKVFINVDKNGSVKGTAYVKPYELDGFVVTEFEGKIDGEYIDIKEKKIIREQRIEGYFWCLKDYRLQLLSTGKLRLEGEWSGYTNTGACVPGKVYLKKSAPRA